MLAILAGCTSSPATRLYVLAPPAQGGGAGAGPNARTVQLQPVLIPDYLDTTDMVLRIGPHEIRPSPTARWGERLGEGVAHALQAELAARLPGQRVILAPPTEPGLVQVLVTVDTIDLWPDGRCVLSAHWQAGGHDGEASLSGPAQAEPDDAGLAASLAGLVANLADTIAADPGLATTSRPSPMTE